MCYNNSMSETSSKKEMRIGGLSFGLTSGVITTLGLIVGLDTATSSKVAVIAGILTIAVADSLSDALGMHLSEESRIDESRKPIVLISIFAFLGKFSVTLLFIIPFLIFTNQLALIVSVMLGIALITALSYLIALRKQESPAKVIFEHVGITVLVVILSYLVGDYATHLSL